MKKKAIIIGATGLVGSELLLLLLKDNTYEKVIVFSRNPTGIQHNKLEENICNLLDLEEQKNKFYADEVYCCIGTTTNKTPNKDSYRKIDIGIPTSIAKLCEKNNIQTLVVISAIGANKESFFFYNKIKAEMEIEIFKYRIPNILVFRPSVINGDRNEKRVVEKISVLFLSLISFILVGPLRKYKSIQASRLA